MFSKSKIIASFAICVLTGCSGSSRQAQLDGGATKAVFSMQLTSTPATASLNPRMLVNADGSLTLGDSGVTFTTAQINVKEIKLKLPEGISCEAAGFVAGTGVTCENETETENGVDQVEAKIMIAGPFVYDLITGVSTPDIGNITLPSGVYRKIEIKLEESQVAGDMFGYSIVASGNFVDASAVSHGLSLKLKFSEEIKIENATGMEVAESVQNTIHANLNVDSWMTGVDLKQCVADGNLVIDSSSDTLFIDDSHKGSGSCNNVDEQIRENIKNSFEMENEEHDSSGDGAAHNVTDTSGVK